MKRPTIIARGSLQRMTETSESAWAAKKFPEAIETMERASRLAPSNPAVLLRLGNMHGLRYDYVAAGCCFDKVLRLAPRKLEGLVAVVNRCQGFRNPDLPEHYLRLALEQPDATPSVLVTLAELCERRHRLPEAADLVNRALHLDSSFPAALLARARLERQSSQLEVAETTLRSFLSVPAPNSWVLVQAWYELGTVLDRQGRFDEAMEAFLQAKKRQQPQADRMPDVRGKIRVIIREQEETITARQLQSWHENLPALTPPRRLALLCGYARTGTTLLEQILDAHPDVVSAEETDVFFDDALPPLSCDLGRPSAWMESLDSAGIEAIEKSRAAYFRSMNALTGNPIAERLLLDKNPMFTYLLPAFIRIFPETKFLIALRDPRDVVISRFMQIRPVTPTSGDSYLSLAGTVTDYTLFMGLWRKLAPLLPSPYLEVRYEDIVTNFEAVARRTLEFLGVPWHERVLKFDEHARHKIVFSPTYADVTQPVFKRAKGRWQHYQKYLEPHLARLEPFIKAFGYEG
jgi:Tfp pilus assembly protein PilF